MFHPEFYPTPRHVLDMMEIDCYGRICADFSAGKGNIVDYLNEHGADRVLACEINEDLCKILAPKCELIGRDFFKVEPSQVSHVQAICINPPFSNADKHILHAWDVAPEGCEITALCNWQTLANSRNSYRTQLDRLIDSYGSKRNLGDCFTVAERTTGVEVGLIKLFKPVHSSSFDFDGFFFTDESEAQENGIMEYNDVRATVNSYVAAVKCFDRCKEVMDEMNSYTRAVGFGEGFKFHVNGSNETLVTKEDFARQMQIKCWKYVFNKIGIEKYVTKGVMEDINKFVNDRLNHPFTMRNVYRMIEIIIGTRGRIMNRAIVEAVDNFTRHTHENRYGVEGWKTNEGHLLNRKFIAGYICEIGWSGDLNIKFYGSRQVEYVIDLMKALCYITATDFDSIQPAFKFKELQSNKWYEWGFFEFKVFKKGTGHFKFKDDKVWETLNRTYAKIKGQVLPETLK